MTEQEARTLAAEFAGHHVWQVQDVAYSVLVSYPDEWVVTLQHRIHPTILYNLVEQPTAEQVQRVNDVGKHPAKYLLGVGSL